MQKGVPGSVFCSPAAILPDHRIENPLTVFVPRVAAIAEFPREIDGHAHCGIQGVAKRTLPLRAGRRVRWTIEVLPEDAAKKVTRSKKASRKPRQAKPTAKQAPLPATPPPAAPPPAPAGRGAWLRATVPVAAVALVVAALAFPRRSPAPPVTSAAPVASSIVVTPPLVSDAPRKPIAKPPTKRATSTAKSVAPVVTAAAEPVKHDEPAPASPAHEAPPPATAMPTSALPAAVTLTGCLEVSTDGDTFRLSDVEGIDAPKSRSWRSGFLKKHPAPVMLVEPPDRQALTTNVGRRVAATGQLASRDLKVRSFRVVSASCN